MDWYIHWGRLSGIKFVTPHQRHSGTAKAICRKRVHIYEKARQAYPSGWSRSNRCRRQSDEVTINKPPEEPEPIQQLCTFQAA